MVKLIFLGIVFLTIGYGAPRNCKVVELKKLGASICLPAGWFREIDANSGSLFACSDKRGRCVTRIGSFPLKGVLTAQFGGRPPVQSIEEMQKLRREEQKPFFHPLRDVKCPMGMESHAKCQTTYYMLEVADRIEDEVMEVEYHMLAKRKWLVLRFQLNPFEVGSSELLKLARQIFDSVVLKGE